MKKKGFTLIELLAVIVILAIIALIATPMILNVIETARMGAAESSVAGYLDAIEKQIMLNQLDSSATPIVDGVYDLPMGGISVKGEKPSEGWIVIENSEVTNYSMKIMDYIVTKGSEATKEGEIAPKPSGTPEVVYGVTKELPTNGETYKAIVYLDPTNYETVCNATNAVSTTLTKEGCMKFYAFAETDDSYTLILDHNTTALVAWNSDGTNTEMKEVKTALETDTASWKTTARLITADEVAEITGAKEALAWTSDKTYASTPVIGTSISYFYLDGASGTDTTWKTQVATTQGASKYAWLYDNVYSCTSYGCNVADDNKYEYGTSESTNNIYGYWTSTPVVGHSDYAWNVHRPGNLCDGSVDNDNYSGVRPVITISKSIIS